MRQAEIISIQRNCVYDGPGVRTTVFLRGCVLRCPWCCNPEAIIRNKSIMIDEKKCLRNKGIESLLCNDCERVRGTRDLLNCPFGAVERISRVYSSEELIQDIMKDIDVFQSSGGGVTFSGGEPLLHVDFIDEVVAFFRGRVNFIIETSAAVSSDCLLRAANVVNGMIIDLKFQKENNLLTKRYIENVRKVYDALREYKKYVRFRFVLVDSLRDNIMDVIDAFKYIGVSRVELIKCHNLGKNKYSKLGLKAKDFTPSNELVSFVSNSFISNNIEVNLLKI